MFQGLKTVSEGLNHREWGRLVPLFVAARDKGTSLGSWESLQDCCIHPEDSGAHCRV